jgi:predicted helicase
VKFIRFAQDKIEKVEQGLVGIITNHSFLDNPTFRGMRKSLMTTFDQLYFIDLHGNAKKKEKTPDGEKDENVFDIEQGVTISILIKKKGIEKKIYHTDFWGTRSHKYQMCLENSFGNIDFSELNPVSPYYFFVPKNNSNIIQYNSYISVSDILKVNTMGFVSGRDDFNINFDKNDLWKKMQVFSKMNPEQARQEFKLGKDSRDWTVATALKDLKANLDEKNVTKVSYRPFDNRFTFYTGNSRGLFCSPQKRIMNFLQDGNIALILVRIGRDISANNYFVTKHITDKSIISTLDNANVFPLFLYEKQNLYTTIEPIIKAQNKQEKDFLEHKKAFEIAECEFFKHKKVFESIKKPSDQEIGIFEEHSMGFEETKTMFERIKENYEKEILKLKKIQEQNKKEHIEILENGFIKRPNFTIDFTKFIKEKYDNQFTPEQILGYIYAILHSETYRKKYAEFLKIDYPKIPFIDDTKIFKQLATIGLELIDLHLMNNEKINLEHKNLGIYKGDGDNLVTKIEYNDNKLYINKNQYFDNIPENIYFFKIGGYQVIDKYLKDRKNRNIFYDFESVEFIVKIIAETIEQMKIIERVTSKII